MAMKEFIKVMKAAGLDVEVFEQEEESYVSNTGISREDSEIEITYCVE